VEVAENAEMPRIVDTILFDIGNTLLDFESLDPRPFLGEGFRLGHEFLTARGHRLPPYPAYARRLRWAMAWRFLRSRLVRREMQLYESMIAVHARLGIHLERATADELAWQICLPMRRVGRADPSARPALLELRERGYKLGIISNTSTPPSALDRHLAEEGVLEFFPLRVYSCSVGYMKPHRRIFEIALERIGSTAATAVYVGDKLAIDVAGAAPVGLLTVLKSPTGAVGSGRWRPDHVVRTVGEVPRVVEAYAAGCLAS
jgi:HAD superfamily hydrolase (TIGR01549 family)